MRRSFKTGEFWLAVLPNLISAAVLSGVVEASEAETLAIGITGGVGAVVYVWKRLTQKQATEVDASSAKKK